MIRRFLRIDPLIFLSSTILFCTLRMVVPNINFLFIPLLILFLFFTWHHFIKENSLELFIRFLKYNLVLLLVGFLILLGNILSSEIIFLAVKEFLNALVVVFIAFTCFTFIKTRKSFEKFVNIFRNQLIFFSIVVAIMGIIKYLLQLCGIYLPAVLSSDQVGTSLNTDYNFNVLFSFLGIISLVFIISRLGKVKFYLLITVLFLNIIFSGSRRGLIFMLIIFVLLFLFGTSLRLDVKKILLRSAVLITILALFFFSFYVYRNTNSIILKNQSTDLLKTSQAQNINTKIGYRYFTMINSKKSSYGFYLDLWDKNRIAVNDGIKNQYLKRDSNNLLLNGNFKFGLKYWYPMAGKIQHEIVDTPYGKGVRVTRFEGDNSGWPLQYLARDIIFYSGHTYVISYKFKIIKGEGIPFKIGFLVDDPILGSGKASNLYPIISDLDNGWKQGLCSYTFWKSRSEVPLFMNSQQNNTVIEFADIKLKDIDSNDTLLKFTDQVSFAKDKIKNFLTHYDSVYYSKSRNSRDQINLIYNGDFESGTRFWLPAASATEHSIVETPYGKGIKVLRKDGVGTYWSLLYDGRPIIYHAEHSYKLSFSFKVAKGSGIPFYVGWQAADGYRGYPSYSLPYKITMLKDGWTKAVCIDKFASTHYDLPTFLNSLKNNSEVEIADVRLEDMDRNDSLPEFVDELYSKYPEINDIPRKSMGFSNLQSDFYGSRTVRWKYSIEVFEDSLTFAQKVFGGGFDYLFLFGKKFSEGEIDYPHNPFLSAFLFSGVIGGLVYIWYIILVVYYYLKNYERHKFFFFSFLIVFCFSFVSGNTHFSVPVFAILSIIPFLTKFLVDKELEQKEV